MAVTFSEKYLEAEPYGYLLHVQESFKFLKSTS